MLSVFFLSLVFIPLDVADDRGTDTFSGVAPFTFALDLICFVDIIFTFFTGYFDTDLKQVVLEHKKIAM